jgi:hypothetical protein
MDPAKVMCAHKTCKCTCDHDDGVRFEGLMYCSQRCADDRGCDHAECNCGDFPVAEPRPQP